MMEQLVILLIVVVVLVILDGLRRRWMERRDRVVIKLDRKGVPPADIDEEELFRSELPNGGARTIPRRGEAVRPGKPAPKLKSLQQQREQVKPEHVPVLLEAVDLEEERIEHTNVYADSSGVAIRGGAASSRETLIDEVVESLTGADEEASMGKYEDSIDDYLEALDEDLRDASVPRARKGGDDEDDDWEEDDAGEDWEDDWDEDGEELGGKGADDEDGDTDEVWEEAWDDDWDEDEDEDDDEDDDALDGDEDEDDFDDDEFEDEDDEDVFPDPYEDYEDDPYAREEPEPVAEAGQARTARRSGRGEERVEPTFGSMLPGRDHQGELFQEADGAAAAPARAAAASAESDAAMDAGDAPDEAGAAAASGIQEVLIINVMARPGRVFSGRDLLPLLQEQGMQLGDMSIFHKHGGERTPGALQFSMANMVKPGTFDLAGMDGFTTPGVSLFMQLPNPSGNMQAFDNMLATARALQLGLDGDLKDENRSVFTRQTAEHCRQRIRDFELKLLARK